MARAPRVMAVEGAPAEPDLLENAPPPREAETLIGHEPARASLIEAFLAAPPQGIILEGPRGIGKATFAFRLAKGLLGGASPDTLFDADAQDRAARQVSAGTHPGVLHLTRAYDEKAKRFKTELTVDTVRKLIPFLGSTAAGGGWRVVIVDAVDDMNANAANALLKSLEEPPARTVFILIAHVAGRVIPTIRSRCRTLRLRPLSHEDVAKALAMLGGDPDLALSAEGSVRRGLALGAAGADAVNTARDILAGDLSSVARRYQLADIAAQKRGEHFAAVADLALDALAARVRAKAASTPIAVLEAYAKAYLDALAERRRVEIFNLDRKEYMLALSTRLAAADRAAARTS